MNTMGTRDLWFIVSITGMVVLIYAVYSIVSCA